MFRKHTQWEGQGELDWLDLQGQAPGPMGTCPSAGQQMPPHTHIVSRPPGPQTPAAHSLPWQTLGTTSRRPPVGVGARGHPDARKKDSV